MTEQQLNDVWTYDQSEQTPTAVIKDSEGFDVGYVRGTGLDPRESAEKLAWRIVADHNLGLLAMAAPAVQPTTDVSALEMRVDGKESVIDSPLDTQLVEALERIIEAAPSGGPLWHGSKQITYARAALAAHRKQVGDV